MFNFGKTRKVKCLDGTSRYVAKRIADAIPLELKNRESNGNLQMRVPEATVSGGVNLKSSIGAIVFAINERNASQVIDFQMAYSVYQNDPCGENDFLKRQVEKIRDERNFLSKLEIRANTLIEMLKNNPDNGDRIIPYCESIMADLDIPSPRSSQNAIDEARANATEMIQGPK